MTPVNAVTVRVPAKVNLQLSVGPPRRDGYHDVVTVYHAVTLFDEVTVAPAARDSLSVTGEGADVVPTDSGNLAARAARALLRAVGGGAAVSPGLDIQISKRIPVAAGLAGGSADAAATLVACNELWQSGLSQRELSDIAAGIGSDVAFALAGGTAIGLGRGEQVTPALASGSFHWVLAFADGGLSTAKVYATCDRLRARRADDRAADPQLDNELMAALRAGDPELLGARLANDLQAAAITLYPPLRRALAAGREVGALAAMVSGSGPTCMYLARDARHAREIAVGLTGAGVCRGVAHVTGPAQGAQVTSMEPV